MVRTLALVFAIILLTLLAIYAEESQPKATLRVTPRAVFTRTDVHAVVTLQQNAPLTGSWSLAWASERAGAGETARQYDTDSPRTTDVWVKDLPPGTWLFLLTIYDAKGKQVFQVDQTLPGPEDK